MDTDDLLAKYLMSFDAHYKLVTIHPWVDGNGRMSRLVMNHLQYELGLVPTKIIKEEKAEYIQALVDSREQGSLEPFREFMLEEHTRNIAKEIEEYKKSQAFDPMNGYSGQKSGQKIGLKSGQKKPVKFWIQWPPTRL